MPRYFCDFCDISLTHDSIVARKAHNAGWKHKLAVQNYFSEIDPSKVQYIIDELTQVYVDAGFPGYPELVPSKGTTLPINEFSLAAAGLAPYPSGAPVPYPSQMEGIPHHLSGSMPIPGMQPQQMYPPPPGFGPPSIPGQEVHKRPFENDGHDDPSKRPRPF